jgi:reactive chlorine resistance protein C
MGMAHASEALNPLTRPADPAVLGVFTRARQERLERIAVRVSRYGVVALLLLFGAMKFTDAEAQAIRPMLENHPFMRVLPALLGVRGASSLIGVIELSTAALMCLRRFSPRLSALGSLLASVTFVLTVSFLFSTPGAFAPDSMLGGFLMKDVLLLAASLHSAAEALRAAHARLPAAR